MRFLKNVKQKQPALAFVCCSLHSITTQYGLLIQRTVRFFIFNSWQTRNYVAMTDQKANFSERRLMDYVNNLKDLPRTDLNCNQTYVGRSFRVAVVVPWRHASSSSQQVWSVTLFLPYLISNIVFSGRVRTLAGNGRQGFKNGVGSDARFNYPEGIYFDTDHKVLYVVEFVSSLVTVHEQVQNPVPRYWSSATTCLNWTGKSTTWLPHTLHWVMYTQIQWQIQGGPGLPLIFRPNWGPKGRKKKISYRALPLSQGMDDRASPLSDGVDPPLIRAWVVRSPA